MIQSVLSGDADDDSAVDVSDIVVTRSTIFDTNERPDLNDCDQSWTFAGADVVCTVSAIIGP